ncbi:GON-4-like protein isoform X1 [Phycodurus eques]|uniref:GON-4-like protein isoform X1 n=1 Tax=Phycodurus eques TaxID=693459 RepID=UPI002ACDF225|nr:GON-4-like protein isoform X1 [Phycodurus eques]
MMKTACKRLKVEAFGLPSPERAADDDDDPDAKLIITTDDECVGSRTARRKRRKPTEEGGDEERRGEGLAIDRQLDQSLESKSKQHKLTSVNVRNIIHEVITNEHVVAMMKAAINETEAVPPFEPKMTRSKLKEVVEKGVVIPAWNISPIKKSRDIGKVHQFVDIPLAEEDSSDEEYRPDDEDEDETAEDTLQESDFESAASPPRGRGPHPDVSRHGARKMLRAESVSMGPPPPPKVPPPSAQTDNFLEKLHAVEAELAVCMEPYQPLQDAGEAAGEGGLMAYRTRSKRPLRDVPLGQLEAELRAPDITPDMYDCGSAHEDRDWTDWLRGLMTSDMDDEECDDEDDPEYNFLADVDEPDQEDYRDDKAVRITKKEVNELMEELFETLKEDLAGQEVDDEGHEEEESQEDARTHAKHDAAAHACHTTEEARGGEAEDGRPMGERRTVMQQLMFMKSAQQHAQRAHALTLDTRHRNTLKQQVQQHVQLLVQIHLLTSPVEELRNEAETTQHFLFELDVLAQRAELMMSSQRSSAFRASNLQGALKLLDALREQPVAYVRRKHMPDARGKMRRFAVMPAELAWIFVTRPVFLYPQLLPRVSLDPALYSPRRTAAFTAAEDCLLVVGLQNLEGARDPARLLCDLLLAKSVDQVRRRILQCCRPGTPDNIVKAFRHKRVVPRMPLACARVAASEQRPPVERDVRLMPLWLLRSLPVISKTVTPLPACKSSGHMTPVDCASTRYPPRLPPNLHYRRVGFVQHASRTPSLPDHTVPSPGGFSPQTPPSRRSPAPPTAVQKVGEAELLGLSKSSKNSTLNVGVAKMTVDGGTSCPLLEEVRPGPRQEVCEWSTAASEPGTTGRDAHAHQETMVPVFAKNVSTGVNGEKLVVWTREADRLILTACQQRGANRRTFRRVSAQLGNQSARQVSLRFHDLLRLFHVATTPASCPSVATQEPETGAQKQTEP